MHLRQLPRILLLLALVPLLAAGAQPDPVVAAAEYLRGDPVFVDPDAERALTDAEAEGLREQVRSSGTPVLVAVLPASAGEPADVVRRLMAETGLSGTYAVIVGGYFRGASTELADADELATRAFQAERDNGAEAVLRRFVEETATAAASPDAPAGAGGASGSGQGGEASGDDDDGGASSLLPLGLLAAGGAGLFVWSRRRRNREEATERAALAADVQIIRSELDVVADDIFRLEADVVLHPAARNDYEAAVERHRVASGALDYVDEPVDLVRVERVVSEARYAMARAKALVADREPPPPPVELTRPGRHDEPPLDLDDRGMPIYAGGLPFYGGGWFGGGGGLFGGLLLGSMLGGWGWGGSTIINNEYHGDSGWDGGGGDPGGGLGGGDWGAGGGDWGGDLGGGDW